MTAFACDVALSAVASDCGLVAELTAELAARLQTAPAWNGEHDGADSAALLGSDHSRIALVLHQHLWQHDARTLADAAVLRDRLSARRDSVCVLTFDDSPVASWLARAPHYDVAGLGRDGIVEFVLGVVASAGGAVNAKPVAANDAQPASRWPEPPTPYLAQPRAHSALRHELDVIVAALKRGLDRARAEQPECPVELHVLPHRMIARVDDVAITFSWVTGRVGTVSDGRLLVIAWSGVTSRVRDVAALKTATPLHERLYVAEGNAPDEWSWRADDLARQPYESAQLVADWLARASIARSG